MLKNGKIVFCPPPFEEVQHEPTRLDKDNKVLEISLHSDLSLLMRVSSLDKLSAQQYATIKEQLQPLIDGSTYKTEIEEAFGKLTDDELLNACPSRYLQTQSEQKAYFEHLYDEDVKVKESARKAKAAAAEKERLSAEENELKDALKNIFKTS